MSTFDPAPEQFSSQQAEAALPIENIGYRQVKVVNSIPGTASHPYEIPPVIGEDIDHTLQQRGNRYGCFTEHARITQAIKAAYRDSPNWESLPPNMKESLEMNAHKVGRILNGDPLYHDSWHDIVGYTKLVADELLGDSK